MFCTNCGREISEGSKFCSLCGTSVKQVVSMAASPSAPMEARTNDMDIHIQVLGWLYLVFGCLGIAAGIFVLGVFSFLGKGFSHLGLPELPFRLFPLASGLGILIAGFVLLLSLPGVIAGYGLLNYRTWARMLAIVLSAINLIHPPFGTLLGVYGLWVLLSEKGTNYYQRRSASIIP
jgi:hypothetical protein